jgi:8-oxo-dGTP pyrophosphatase MutT (NUDIX family)
MQKPQDFSAKICLTAAGCLVHENKVLLVKHKKLQAWLNPGGHIEDNELPHAAAEREFWEETGIKVRALQLTSDTPQPTNHDEYLPSPILTNLHWISVPNYEARMKKADDYQKEAVWKKGCEQHLGFVYLVEAVEGLDFKKNVEETDGIAWFSEDELEDIETFANIRYEVRKALEITRKMKKK